VYLCVGLARVQASNKIFAKLLVRNAALKEPTHATQSRQDTKLQGKSGKVKLNSYKMLYNV
jgi:hypothetical protein